MLGASGLRVQYLRVVERKQGSAYKVRGAVAPEGRDTVPLSAYDMPHESRRWTALSVQRFSAIICPGALLAGGQVGAEALQERRLPRPDLAARPCAGAAEELVALFGSVLEGCAGWSLPPTVWSMAAAAMGWGMNSMQGSCVVAGSR